ncbi:unnamed protein product [Meloidogyne enterolobii]|uniref:Uncharacterized protein n=1 Tax=Meloidogyne enterolobii TaxID=390850 RepID=A0ACB0YJW4_MELEN
MVDKTISLKKAIADVIKTVELWNLMLILSLYCHLIIIILLTNL